MSVKPITQTLAMLHGGVFIDTASDKLAELVKMVDETGPATPCQTASVFVGSADYRNRHTPG